MKNDKLLFRNPAAVLFLGAAPALGASTDVRAALAMSAAVLGVLLCSSRLLGRIRFKQRVLEHARVVDMSRLGGDSVMLLTKVEMTNLANNARMCYTVVSPHEANLRESKISIKSPIAQALMGKKVGDIVEVQVPAGLQRFRIESISL